MSKQNQQNFSQKCCQRDKKRERLRFGNRTWLFLGCDGGGAGLAGDEHAGASALALRAGRGEEQGAHARRGCRRLLRLLERGERGGVEARWRAESGSPLSLALVHAPSRRRGSAQLLLLLLLQGMKL